MMVERRLNVLRLLPGFYDLSVSRHLLPSRKIVKLVIFIPLILLDCETCDLTDIPASVYVRKAAARRLSTIHDILRSLSLVQSFLKRYNAPFRGVKALFMKTQYKPVLIKNSRGRSREFALRHFLREIGVGNADCVFV